MSLYFVCDVNSFNLSIIFITIYIDIFYDIMARMRSNTWLGCLCLVWILVSWFEDWLRVWGLNGLYSGGWIDYSGHILFYSILLVVYGILVNDEDVISEQGENVAGLDFMFVFHCWFRVYSVYSVVHFVQEILERVSRFNMM